MSCYTLMYETAPITMSWKLLAGSSQPIQFHIYDVLCGNDECLEITSSCRWHFASSVQYDFGDVPPHEWSWMTSRWLKRGWNNCPVWNRIEIWFGTNITKFSTRKNVEIQIGSYWVVSIFSCGIKQSIEYFCIKDWNAIIVTILHWIKYHLSDTIPTTKHPIVMLL